MRPLVTAASLGGARRDDDCRLQVDSLSDEWSVESWAAENCHETCCALNDFNGVILPCDLGGRLPRPEGDEELSDIEQDVCDVPDEFSGRYGDFGCGVVVLSCGRLDETAAWLWPGLALAGGQGNGVPR